MVHASTSLTSFMLEPENMSADRLPENQARDMHKRPVAAASWLQSSGQGLSPSARLCAQAEANKSCSQQDTWYAGAGWLFHAFVWFLPPPAKHMFCLSRAEGKFIKSYIHAFLQQVLPRSYLCATHRVKCGHRLHREDSIREGTRCIKEIITAWDRHLGDTADWAVRERDVGAEACGRGMDQPQGLCTCFACCLQCFCFWAEEPQCEGLGPASAPLVWPWASHSPTLGLGFLLC